jgi:serine/threonine protein kinase
VWSGIFESFLEGIGISPIKGLPTSLLDEQKQHLSDGLRAIHKLGVLHDDLKIQNTLEDANSRAYIIDFGFLSRKRSSLLR